MAAAGFRRIAGEGTAVLAWLVWVRALDPGNGGNCSGCGVAPTGGDGWQGLLLVAGWLISGFESWIDLRIGWAGSFKLIIGLVCIALELWFGS